MVEPCTYVIFGATGNLSSLKLMPALYHLECAGCLPEGTIILAVGRRDWDRDHCISEVREWVADKARGGMDDEVFARFAERLHYFKGDLTDHASYEEMSTTLAQAENFPKNIAFYMSIRPADFSTVIRNLSEVGLLCEDHGWRRVVVEKPFGYDLETATLLQKSMEKYLKEHQIYRIDHYLGKGTVQNVLVFRFANLMLEPLWNRNYIDHIQITHSEAIGVENRADYYDGSGALRDMIQSHLLQLLTLVAMEPPVSMESEAIRDEKVKVLKSIRPIPSSAVHAHAFRAQYSSGMIDGKRVCGYLEEDKVPHDSVTETYAAVKLYIDNWRWRGVPIYLRTGKRLARAQSAVSIRFKHPPQQLFRNTQIEKMHPNWLLLGIQPTECLRIELSVKEPGLQMKTRTTSLDASFRENGKAPTDAYEDLLLDIIEGDSTLFLRYDEVEWAWRIVDPILKVWSVEREYINTYESGTWGPIESRRLFDSETHNWRHSLSPEDEG